MPKRTLAILAAAAFGALALPFGLPQVADAAGTTYNALSIKPLPLEQPGTLDPTTTNTVTACVQPLSGGKVVPGAQVWLSIASGLFTAPPGPGGTATAEGTPLSSSAQEFTVETSCTYQNNESHGTLMYSIPVTYTGPNPKLSHGRDVIGAASDNTSFDAATGECGGSGICNTGTYAFSPVASYTFSEVPIAPTASLNANQSVVFTVTALDDSVPTPQPVPGAFVDLSLTSSAASGGSATAVNTFSGYPKIPVSNSPERFGADSAGQVAITYTTPKVLPTSGTDTITAQNRPMSPTFPPVSTTYTYGSTTAFSQDPYTAVAPFRICDTRPVTGGISSNQCNTGVGSGPIGPNESRAVVVTGGVVPASASAIVVNLTAIAPTVGTFLSVYPAGGAHTTSTVNPQKNQVIATLVEVAIGSGGAIDVYNNMGTVNIAVDIEGYVDSSSTGLFNPTVPTRICDTRTAGGGVPSNQCNTNGQSPIGPNGVLTFNVASAGSPVPTTGVTAVVFNLTAISPSTTTVLTAYPSNLSSHPIVSNLNINPNAAVANRVIVPVPPSCSGTSCTVDIWNSVGSVNVAVDIDGWFGTSAGSQFTALATPARVCDTQTGGNAQGCTNPGTVGAGQILNVDVTGIDGIPVLGSTHTPVAIVANITAVNATTGTFVTVYPGPLGTTRPNASDLNVPTFEPITNLVVVGVGSDGTINLFNDLGNVNLIVDVYGYYS